MRSSRPTFLTTDRLQGMPKSFTTCMCKAVGPMGFLDSWNCLDRSRFSCGMCLCGVGIGMDHVLRKGGSNEG